MRMTSRTSINGMKLISGSSRGRPPRRFIGSAAFVVGKIDQLDRLLLHLDDEAVDFRAKMAIEDHARDRDDQSERGVVQRDGNAMRERDRVRPRPALRAEDPDPPDDGAEEAQ